MKRLNIQQLEGIETSFNESVGILKSAFEHVDPKKGEPDQVSFFAVGMEYLDTFLDGDSMDAQQAFRLALKNIETYSDTLVEYDKITPREAQKFREEAQVQFKAIVEALEHSFLNY